MPERIPFWDPEMEVMFETDTGCPSQDTLHIVVSGDHTVTSVVGNLHRLGQTVVVTKAFPLSSYLAGPWQEKLQ
jgi:hypothetical protein